MKNTMAWTRIPSTAIAIVTEINAALRLGKHVSYDFPQQADWFLLIQGRELPVRDLPSFALRTPPAICL